MNFFVVSPYPKSGTSFTLQLINQHSYCDNNINRENLIMAHVLWGIGKFKSAVSSKFYNKILTDDDKLSVRHMILNSFVVDNVRLCGQKYPFSNRPDVIFDIIPDCKLVYIARDPRDSYASYRQMKQMRTETPLSVEQWTDDHFMQILGAQSLDSLSLLLCYERLVTDYYNQSKLIQQYLEVPVEDLNPTNFGKEIFDTYSMQSNLKTQIDSTGLTASRIGRYRNDLTSQEIDYLNTNAMPHYDTYTKRC